MANQRRPRRRDNLVESVLRACRQDPLVASGGDVIVAFSGGPDSTAMLHALWRARHTMGLRLHVVHVDHGLRSVSAEDADRAAAFAAELGLPVEVARVRPRGRGEEAARRARHAALEAAAGRLGGHSVALGHTAADQAETVLLHLLRGTGVGGLAAMSARDGHRFRPLLEVSRVQVLAYCRRQGLAPLVDGTNADPTYTRNRVRHELMPLLEARFNPRIEDALRRLARAARDEHAVVAAAAQAWLPGAGPISRRDFVLLPPAVQAEVLRTAWARARESGPAPGGAERIDQALRLARSQRPGMIQLGAGFELLADDKTLQIRRSEPASRHSPGPSRLLTEP